jgi:outer membrane protein assembly factor BamB
MQISGLRKIMSQSRCSAFLGRLGFSVILLGGVSFGAPVRGWLSWRGPEQTGVSRETGLPSKLSAQDALWAVDFPGQSAPVIANGKVYAMGYANRGPDLQEGVACFDADTGQKEWQQLYNDYLSDTIYLRYATASPALDGETGNVYMQGSQGVFAAFSSDGKLLWRHSLMEEFGRLTFPNGRTATPAIDANLVITRGITANWGTQGPAADRFYAFDKKTGELVWASSPGAQPKDNSFSHPQFAWYHGMRVFYAGTGDGSVVCVNARTGEPIWRVSLFRAGINATVLVHNDDKVIAIYGTPYELGQMVALKVPDVMPTNAAAGPVVLERKQLELWEDNISSSTSSPIMEGDTVFMVAEKGDLFAVNANTGAIKWKLKLGIEQRNSCPLYADGSTCRSSTIRKPRPAVKPRLAPREPFILSNQAKPRARSFVMRCWTAAVLARRSPITGRYICRRRAIFIAGEGKVITPAARLPFRRNCGLHREKLLSFKSFLRRFSCIQATKPVFESGRLMLSASLSRKGSRRARSNG